MKRRVQVLSFTYGTEYLKMLKRPWKFNKLVKFNEELFLNVFNIILFFIILSI